MTIADTAQQMVPLREGMFEMPDTIEGTPKLFGQRCTACEEVFNTTERVYCANCSEEALGASRWAPAGPSSATRLCASSSRGRSSRRPTSWRE